MAQCTECKTIMKTGIAIQRTPTATIEWVCKPCFATHGYQYFMKPRVETAHD